MEGREPESHDIQEEAESDNPTRPEGVRVFATDAWIPMWEQSIPGGRIVLGSVPTSCNLYLEPEPHFAIEVNLEGQEALGHHRILTQQGEQVPMQFDGLQYDNYPIRGNNYLTSRWDIANQDVQIHAKYRLSDKGLRTLRVSDDPTAEVHIR